MSAAPDHTQALREAALAVSTAEGEHVFDQLVTALARILGVDFALISVYVEPQRKRLRTLATFFGGRLAKNVEYPVAGTPCEQAIGRSFGYFPRGVARQFPHDRLLADHGIEGYAATTLHDAHGAPVGALTVMSSSDLADAPLAEALLNIFGARVSAEIGRRRSEASYRAIFENAETAIIVLDIDNGAIVDVNPKACAAYGYSAEEFKRRTANELSSGVPPYTGEQAVRYLKRARDGELVRGEWQRRNKDGSLHWDEMTVKRVEIAGRPHILVASREVTERKAAEQAVRVSEEQYRAIFNASSDALVLRDAEFRIVDVNAAYETMGGTGRDQVIGLQDLTLTRDATAVVQRRELHREAIAGKPVHFEADGKRPDGTPFVLEVRGVPMSFRGAPHVLYMGRDVTEAKLAERALRASEEQYRAIFNAAADAFMLRDAHYRVVEINPAYESLSGLARDEVIGATHAVLGLAEHEDERLALHRRALEGESLRLELDSARRDGSRVRIELQIGPMRYRGAPHVLYVARNITERKRAEEALRTSWEQYRSIFNASADSLVLRDAEFRIVDVNPAYESISGRTRAEALGLREVTMSDRELTARIQSLHARALAGEHVQWEARAQRKNGEPFDIEVRGVPVQHQGQPHVLYVGRDITDRKRAEGERAELEAQLRQAQKMEAIGQLTGGIAHDFNNILQGILGNLVLAEERQAELGDAKLARYLERAHTASQRARDLIQQMLTFSRGRSGERTPMSPGALLKDATRLLRPTLPASIELGIELADSAPAALLDPVQFEQVLLNLCINARDAMAGAGSLVLGARSAEHRGAVCASCRQRIDGRFLEISVHDSGPGIAPQVRERMFDPFFSTKEVGKGSGMGLAMVHGIVHQHGGHVLVENVPGAGARFGILLPPAAVPAMGGTGAARTSSSTASARLSGRVLLAEDETSIRELLEDLLGGWGLEVVARADGAAARDAFAEDPQGFDLVLTDQTMPRLTGLQLARLVTRMRPGIPVILCTGYGEDLKPRELEAAGVRTLANKPVAPAQLRELLRAALPTRNKEPT
ncbi:MAG TPA: PAS domain S-box protein [Burkholderiales bacterium]|nr:PAS domain S-box protein [Burkholderiales bacterium]